MDLKMPKKVSPLNKRKGFVGIDPDQSLNEILELISDRPCPAVCSKFYPDRGHFYMLHRWLACLLLEEGLHERKATPELELAQEHLCHALLCLANNKQADYLSPDRKSGPRHHDDNVREATLCAAARFNYAQLIGLHKGVERWWATIVRKSDPLYKLPTNLGKLIGNVEQGNSIADKSTLLSFYACFIDATPNEAEQHSLLLKEHVERILLP
ncbi:hypothetical protein [Yoonia vestfoldensis]|uniref:Uncharacterized protein n=1 Tax=Yoonia vestfoldensis SKA53 TaxID=314232 RepID=A3V914_9RHOB|nr:hypothetical protein [Yoonia vestfoldensis]EAQ05377.1 hypothetical protein SKA53_00335 [Yoonia vestfoldensis SKA53]